MSLIEIIKDMKQIGPRATLADIEQCLPRSTAAAQELLSDLHEALIEADPSEIASGSKETATHFVWVISSNPRTGSKLCLHQFKLPPGHSWPCQYRP